MRFARLRSSLEVTGLLAIAAVTLTACGGSTSSSSSSTNATAVNPAKDSAIAATVPAKFQGKTLVVATDASHAPNEFLAADGKTIQGMDVDLGNAIAGVLGLKAEFRNATFADILPSVASGKASVGMSSFTDTKEREKSVDFVTYLTAGTAFFVLADGGPTINGLAGLCGHTVAVENGTVQQADAEAQAKKCPAGKKLTVVSFPDQDSANNAVSTGRAQVGMSDSPIAAYLVMKSGGKLKLSGSPYGVAPYGIALQKNSGLSQPVLAAIKSLIASGDYKKILTKWGLEGEAVATPTINGATR